MCGRFAASTRADGGRALPSCHLRPGQRRGRRVCDLGISACRQATQGIPAAKEEAWTMREQKFPAGWDEQRVKRLLSELDARTDEEWIAADEAAAADGTDQTVITVPAALLPAIRR